MPRHTKKIKFIYVAEIQIYQVVILKFKNSFIQIKYSKKKMFLN